MTREAAATPVTDKRTTALAQNGFRTEMVASDCPDDMMEVALWHVAENREASNAEYDAMTAAGLWQPHRAGGVDANLWAQKMPLGGVGFGASAVTSFDAEGLIDVPKLPEFQSCPALAELVREAPTYGLDPTAAVSYAVGIIANLAGERFDVRKPKAPASVSVHLPMPVVVLNASGAGKSTLHDTVALGALFILRSRNAAVQLAAARFEHEYKAYVAACKKSNTHPKECKMLKPVRLFEGANVTPQAWQQILCANQPSTLCISDEVGTFFENGKGNMKNAMSDVLVMMYDGKAIKPYRVGKAQAQGKIVAQGAFETEARGIGRASLVGLTQLRKWKEEILGNGELRYLTNSGALARLFIVPAMTKLSIGERDRNTLVPGTGTDSPFKMWEACVTAFAWHCCAFIDRISEYGREVGEFRIAPVMRELTMPWGGTVWDIEPMPVQVPNGCIDADAPPKVPPKVMLGGDAQRFLSLRLTETGNAWLVEQRASFSDLADTGAFGRGVQDLETINARLLDNVLRVAAAIHCINEANELLALDWFKEEDRGAGPLEIPDIVLKDAWDFVQHALLASLSKGCYGHRIAGKKTKFEARSEDLNSPTEASAVAAAAAGIENILLRRIAKLGSTTPGDVQRQLSKKQQRDHFPDAAATRAALDRLAAAGRILKTGEGKGATYALAVNKPSNEES